MSAETGLWGRWGESAQGGPRATVLCGFSLQLWMRLSGALQKKRNSELSYREIVKNSSNDETIAAKQVTRGGAGGGPEEVQSPLFWQEGGSPLRLPLTGLLGREGSPFTHGCGLE